MRELFSAIKRLEYGQRNLPVVGIDNGWAAVADGILAYSSATEFTAAGVDLSDILQPGMFIRWKQNGTVKYGRITAVQWSDPNTTITIVGDAIENDAVENVYVSRVLAPQGLPFLLALVTYDFVHADSVRTTASTTFVDMPDMSVSVELSTSAVVFIIGMAQVKNSLAGTHVTMSLNSGDNTRLSVYSGMHNAAHYNSMLTIQYIAALSSGSYSFKLRWCVGGGTGTVYGRSLSVLAFTQ